MWLTVFGYNCYFFVTVTKREKIGYCYKLCVSLLLNLFNITKIWVNIANFFLFSHTLPNYLTNLLGILVIINQFRNTNQTNV